MYIFAPGVGIAKKTHYLIWINLIGGLLNLSLNILLIPSLGIVGAGLATMISSMCLFAMYMITSQKLYYVPHYWSSIMLGVIMAAVIAWWLPQLSVNDVTRWALNLSALLSMIIFSFAIGLIRITELKQAIVLIRKRL
jgi:O-antigen/teichoic acid export membrane protein